MGGSDRTPVPSRVLLQVPARVDRIKITGLKRTHDDYVKQASGDIFKATNFQDIMVESMKIKSFLHELGIFKVVKVHIDISRGKDATPNGYEVTFKNEEMPWIKGSIGTEVGQNEGLIHIETNIANIMGRGESVTIHGLCSRTHNNDLTLKFWKSFFHTNFVRNRPEISLSLFRHIDRKDISSFQTTKMGCMAEFSFLSSFLVPMVHKIEYEASVRELSLLNKNVPFMIREHCGPKLASLVRYSMTFDQRDDTIFPTRGVLLRSVSEYCGLGGNISYISTSAHAEVSVPIMRNIVAQMCGSLGIIAETPNTKQLPLGNLFYCGGPLHLRGFQYGCAGPVVDGTPIGAQMNWCTGFHIWAPLPFPSVFKGWSDNLRTHFFYNMGNFDTFTTEKMRAAAGIGLALRFINRARIELNYCIPVQKYASDKFVNGFQWGIGYEFV